jgi:hypothetical protein
MNGSGAAWRAAPGIEKKCGNQQIFCSHVSRRSSSNNRLYRNFQRLIEWPIVTNRADAAASAEQHKAGYAAGDGTQ